MCKLILHPKKKRINLLFIYFYFHVRVNILFLKPPKKPNTRIKKIKQCTINIDCCMFFLAAIKHINLQGGEGVDIMRHFFKNIKIRFKA